MREITENPSARICDWNDSYINVRYYFEAEVSDIDINSMDCVATEAIAVPTHGIDVKYLSINLS